MKEIAMKRFTLISLLLLGIFCVALPIQYIIRQPQPAQHVVKGVAYEAQLAPEHLDDIDADHRITLNGLLDEADRKKTGRKRLIALQLISTVGTANPYVDKVFSNISLNLFTMLKRTVRIFDVLLPAVNTLHNYFDTLERLSTGATKKLFTRLHRFFIVSQLMLAKEYYGWALWYQDKGLKDKMMNIVTIAQALLYRIKDENAEALVLYNKLDKFQPVSFAEEVKKMGVVATGGRR